MVVGGITERKLNSRKYFNSGRVSREVKTLSIPKRTLDSWGPQFREKVTLFPLGGKDGRLGLLIIPDLSPLNTYYNPLSIIRSLERSLEADYTVAMRNLVYANDNPKDPQFFEAHKFLEEIEFDFDAEEERKREWSDKIKRETAKRTPLLRLPEHLNKKPKKKS